MGQHEHATESSRHAEVVAFLSSPNSYPHGPDDVRIIETHTALVFLAGDRVYKLKRPIKLDFADCRSLDSRHRSCLGEFEINQQLAPDIYLAVIAVTFDQCGKLALDGVGTPVDWLVVMRRLDENQALDRMVCERRVRAADLDRVCHRLAEFYRSQPRIDIAPGDWLGLWQEKIGKIRLSLADRLFGLPGNLYEPPLRAVEAFLATEHELLTQLLKSRRIFDGHGDLKPEHIYLGEQVFVIDRIEFDERLRWCDPFDEIAFLGLECTKLRADWIAPVLIEMLAQRFGERRPQHLLRFYHVYRACLRARLMIEHLRDEDPRTPELWPLKTRQYLELAMTRLPLSGQS